VKRNTVWKVPAFGAAVALASLILLAPPLESRDAKPAPDVVLQAIARIGDNYVDPTRIDPKAMLLAALERVQTDIAEVMVEVRENRSAVTVTVNDQVRIFPVADVDSDAQLAARLEEILHFVGSNLDPATDATEIEYAAVNGMLATLDPHSALLDREEVRELSIRTVGQFGGVGLVIALRKDDVTGRNRLTVVSLASGDTPASRAGLASGDVITRIGDDSTDTLTLTEAQNRLRGAPDTKVRLTVERPGAPAELAFDLTRAVIHVSGVHARLLSGGVGYLKIDQFGIDVAAELTRGMADLRQQGAHAWILDLRGNPGGLLDQGVRIADMFLDRGTIVTTVGYAGKQRDAKVAQEAGTDHAPLVVLVDGGSASASEVVAGALKNLDRAVILGQRTFGKGSVQILFDDGDGSELKLTVAQYLTPNDVSIQSVGITPDVELQPVFVPEKVADAKDVVRLLAPLHRPSEADLEQHLVSDNTVAGEKPLETVRYLADPPPSTKTPAAELQDFQMRFARELLASATSASRTGLLAEGKALLARRKTEEDLRIAAALARLGVDWSVGEPQAGARLVATFTTDKPGNRVLAGETLALRGTVNNAGTAPAYRVHARVRSDDWSFDETELPFGRIDPGQSHTFAALVSIPASASARLDRLDWDVTSAGDGPVAAAPTTVDVAGQPRPQFAVTYQVIDDGDGGNGDGLLRRGESPRLHVEVKNVGRGPALMTSASLRNASGDGVVVKRSRFDGIKLAPGATSALDFSFSVKQSFAASEVIVELTVRDDTMHQGLTQKLHFAVSPPGSVPHASSQTDQTRGQIAPPTLTLAGAAPTTREDHIALTGRASSEHYIEDLYVVVSNRDRRISGRKVFYRSNRGHADGKTLDFSASIPLWPGDNYVAVVARESKDVRTVERLWVLREIAPEAPGGRK